MVDVALKIAPNVRTILKGLQVSAPLPHLHLTHPYAPLIQTIHHARTNCFAHGLIRCVGYFNALIIRHQYHVK